VLLALAASLALTACGGDDEPTAPRAPARTDTTTGPAGAKITAEAVLRAADLPNGWASALREDLREQSDCAAFKEARAASSAHVLSRTFSHSSEGSVSQTVYLYDDEQQARGLYRKLVSLETRKCRGLFTRDRLKRLFKTNIKAGDVGSSEPPLDPAGDESHAVRITVDYTRSKRSRRLRQDLIFVRVGRGISISSFINETQPFDKQLRARLTRTAARKLSAALALGGGDERLAPSA